MSGVIGEEPVCVCRRFLGNEGKVLVPSLLVVSDTAGRTRTPHTEPVRPLPGATVPGDTVHPALPAGRCHRTTLRRYFRIGRGGVDWNPREPVRTWPDLRGAGGGHSLCRSAPITRVSSAGGCAGTVSCTSAHAANIPLVGCSAIYSVGGWLDRVVQQIAPGMAAVSIAAQESRAFGQLELPFGKTIGNDAQERGTL